MNLALAHIAETRYRQAQPLEHRGQARKPSLVHRSISPQSARLQQHIGHRRKHHAPHQIFPGNRPPESALQPRLPGAQERFRVLPGHGGHEIDGQLVARLHEPAEVERGDARHAVLSKHHLAHLASDQTPPAPELERPAHANVVQLARPARVGGDGAERRRSRAEGHARRQQAFPHRASDGHDHCIGPLQPAVDQAQREAVALAARRLHGSHFAFHELPYPSRRARCAQAVEHARGLVGQRIQPALPLFAPYEPALGEEAQHRIGPHVHWRRRVVARRRTAFERRLAGAQRLFHKRGVAVPPRVDHCVGKVAAAVARGQNRAPHAIGRLVHGHAHLGERTSAASRLGRGHRRRKPRRPGAYDCNRLHGPSIKERRPSAEDRLRSESNPQLRATQRGVRGSGEPLPRRPYLLSSCGMGASSRSSRLPSYT